MFIKNLLENIVIQPRPTFSNNFDNRFPLGIKSEHFHCLRAIHDNRGTWGFWTMATAVWWLRLYDDGLKIISK